MATEQNPMEQDYLQQIQQLKDNMVSKDDYDALMAENRKLLTSIVNGSGISKEEKEEKEINIDDLRKDLYSEETSGMTNLDYVTKTLELRKAIIESGGRDPFLPVGEKTPSTAFDEDKANNVAAALASCVEVADGDPQVFQREFVRILR